MMVEPLKFRQQHRLGPRTPALPSEVGVHGETFDELGSPNMSCTRIANVFQAGKLSAAELGRRCAAFDHSQRIPIKQSWQDPQTSLGSSGLFDVLLGGEKIIGCGKLRRTKSSFYRQTPKAGLNDLFGRFGHRSVSALEPWR
jgi:hypothetical protein